LLYFNDEYNDSLTVFKQHLNADKTFYPLALHATDIVTSDYPVSRELYDKYSENLRKAVDAVFYKEEDSDLALRLKANATRFGAFKAYNATQDIRREGREKSLTDAEWTEKRYNSFQAAEYNTAVARSRTAKQFEEFMDKERLDALPNLKWLPSTSAEPREAHRVFWNRIWKKTDPFWSKNQPGNLWNCKCDWHETDEPVTDGNPQTETAALGLDGNPAKTGKIFSDKASYVARLTPKSKEIVENYVKPVMEHCEEYIKYKNDPDLKDGKFEWKSGGYILTHKFKAPDHAGDKTGGVHGETTTNDLLVKSGKCIIRMPENIDDNTIVLGRPYKELLKYKDNGERYGYPDDYFDGQTWDVKKIDDANENTIRGYIKNGRKADNVIMYFQIDKTELLINAIAREVGKREPLGELNTLPNIYLIDDNGELIEFWNKKSGFNKSALGRKK